ncbi:hypothetical protein GCM10022211_14150 [Sphingomonas humi]|uniref:Uncharacterized protein n=1 Tax=Sphingomonas humi TaxID=335630 RepID=A0ABP7RXF9_9SPHN
MAIGGFWLAILGLFAGWWGAWGGWALAVTGLLMCAVQWTLAYTQRCPSCDKSIYIKENLPLETAGGCLTMGLRALPEARCSRCQTRLD